MLDSDQATDERGLDPSSVSGFPAQEIVAGRLYRLGGFVELDGRITWAPKIPGRYAPHSCYLVFDDGRGYVIDTGLAAHRSIIIDQLKEIVPVGMPLTIFLTRSEYMCSGNLAPICESCGVDELVTLSRNPFAGSSDLVKGIADKVRRTEPERGAVVPVGSSKSLVMIPPLLRLLGTFWVYDSVGKTMFTSDLFGHVFVDKPGDRVIIDSLADDNTTYEQVREHTLMRYHWLPMATTEPLIAWLENVFSTYEVENIAPTSGCVLKGTPLVKKHYDLIVELLQRVPEEFDTMKATGEAR